VSDFASLVYYKPSLNL